MHRFQDVERVLDAWRTAERRVSELPPGNQRDAAEAEAQHLAREYRTLTDGSDATGPDPEMAATASTAD